jgi:hypothetical protein
MKTALGLLLAAVLLLTVPAGAYAAACRGGGVTYHGDTPARFTGYTAYDGMNCASARYVINRWIRRQYARTGRFRRKFYDGYVTWHGRQISPRRWQYREFTTGTRFRFTAYLI